MLTIDGATEHMKQNSEFMKSLGSTMIIMLLNLIDSRKKVEAEMRRNLRAERVPKML